MKNIVDNLEPQSNIYIPKGDDSRACIDAFQEATGLEVPDFVGEDLGATSQGFEFWKVKGIDVPIYVKEWGGIGVTGTDSIIENNGGLSGNKLKAARIGGPMCRYSIIAEEEKVAAVEGIAATDPRYSSSMVEIPASRPALLSRAASWRELGFRALDIPLSGGSLEAAVRLSGIGIGADIVETGETARQNGLLEVIKLCDIYPEMVWRPDNENLQ